MAQPLNELGFWYFLVIPISVPTQLFYKRSFRKPWDKFSFLRKVKSSQLLCSLFALTLHDFVWSHAALITPLVLSVTHRNELKFWIPQHHIQQFVLKSLSQASVQLWTGVILNPCSGPFRYGFQGILLMVHEMNRLKWLDNLQVHEIFYYLNFLKEAAVLNGVIFTTV